MLFHRLCGQLVHRRATERRPSTVALHAILACPEQKQILTLATHLIQYDYLLFLIISLIGVRFQNKRFLNIKLFFSQIILFVLPIHTVINTAASRCCENMNNSPVWICLLFGVPKDNKAKCIKEYCILFHLFEKQMEARG